MGKEILHIHRVHSPVRVLGPFSRAVIWVQGCVGNCRGCIAPYTKDMLKGTAIQRDALLEWVLSCEEIEGITISGGEPMLQAGTLSRLIDDCRKEKDMGVVCYTGHVYDELAKSVDPDIISLLKKADILIDGPYIRKLHGSYLWRASSNQRLIPLTDRYRNIVETLDSKTDKTAGIEFSLESSGLILYSGIPSTPDFDTKMIRQLNRKDK